MAVEYFYRWDRNEDTNGAAILIIPGVPLRDLTAEDLAVLPEHLIEQVKASELYTTRPGPRRSESKPTEEGPTDGNRV
jgi:hypothetical protein